MQITYIGVPLAVAGGLPLLYGFLRAAWIYVKLSRSIPWELRPYFRLIPNPVLGTVIVTAKRLRLTQLGLWQSKSIRQGKVAHKWIHLTIFTLTRGFWYWLQTVLRGKKFERAISDVECGWTADESDEMERDSIRRCAWIYPPRRLYRPWMSMALRFDLNFVESRYISEASKRAAIGYGLGAVGLADGGDGSRPSLSSGSERW